MLPNSRILPNALPLLKVALLYWRSALRYTKGQPSYAPNIPLLSIHLPLGTVTQKHISIWVEAGVDTVGMLFAGVILMNYATFVWEQGVPNTLFLLHANIA